MKGTSIEIASKITEILKQETSKYKSKAYALGFSGGLDSTILMAASGLALNPYTVGFASSKDMENATNAANALGFQLKKVILDDIDINEYIKIMKDIDSGISKSDMGYELVLMILLDRIEEDYLITGQGSDELFYGYRRFIDEPNLRNKHHLYKLYSDTLPREQKIADYFGKHLVTPYLNEEIVSIAQDLPKELNVDGERNKIILRNVAENLGIPERIRETRKKAAQYGSGISKFLRNAAEI